MKTYVLAILLVAPSLIAQEAKPVIVEAAQTDKNLGTFEVKEPRYDALLTCSTDKGKLAVCMIAKGHTLEQVVEAMREAQTPVIRSGCGGLMTSPATGLMPFPEVPAVLPITGVQDAVSYPITLTPLQ